MTPLPSLSSANKLETFKLKYCRMCAIELKQGVCIFGDEGKRLLIPEKIRKTIAILVLEEDSLPKKICTDCCSSLEDYSKYKDTVMDAQEKLTMIARNLEKCNNNNEDQSLMSNSNIKAAAFYSPKSTFNFNTSPESSCHSNSSFSQPRSSPVKTPDCTSFISGDESCKSNEVNDTDESTSRDIQIQEETETIHQNVFPKKKNKVQSPKTQTLDKPVLKIQVDSSQSQKPTLNSENHDIEYLFQCGICGVPFEDRHSLIKHHGEQHDIEKYPEPMFGCSICPRISENYNAIRIHIYRHLKEGIHKCSTCGKSFPLKDQLDRHWISAHNTGGKAFSCKVCGKRFTAKCSLVVHMTSKHPLPIGEEKSIPCRTPGSSSEIPNINSTIPTSKDQDINNDQASVVERDFDDYNNDASPMMPDSEDIRQEEVEESNQPTEKEDSNLTKRKSSSSSNSSSPKKDEVPAADTDKDVGTWRCEYCDKIFQTKVGYMTHIATHKGKRFECDFCNASFTQKGSLAHHITSQHNQSPKQFKCDKCSKEFITSKLLKRHFRLHLEPRADSKCLVCSKIYKSALHLKSHMKIHNNLKKFVCSDCGKRFPNQHKLNHHENTHTGLRPFQCPHCSYAARSTGPFYRHVKAHQKKLSNNNNNNNNNNNKEISNGSASASSLVVVLTKSHSNQHNMSTLEDLSTKSPQKSQQLPLPSCSSSPYIPNGPINAHHQLSSSSHHSHLQSSHQIVTSDSLTTTNPHHHDNQQIQQQQQPSHLWNSTSVSSGSGNNKNYSNTTAINSSNNGLELVDCAIHNALVVGDNNNYSQQISQGGYSQQGMIIAHHNPHNHPHGTYISTTAPSSSSTISILNVSSSGGSGGQQSEPMELSYKLNIDQDMPMELTKVFQRDPLELCVRQEFAPLMDLSSRVSVAADGNGMTISSMPLNLNNTATMNCNSLNNYHKLDLTERELSFNDLSGAFRQPIDLIARTEDSSHHQQLDGNLVDLSLRSSFVQDQSASSFLRELIDLSARSESFHGELNLTKSSHHHGSHNSHHNSNNNNHGSGGGGTGNKTGHHHQGNLQSVIYQDAMFGLN